MFSYNKVSISIEFMSSWIKVLRTVNSNLANNSAQQVKGISSRSLGDFSFIITTTSFYGVFSVGTILVKINNLLFSWTVKAF